MRRSTETMGSGESMPVASITTDEGRAENRRVDVLVLGQGEIVVARLTPTMTLEFK